MTTTDRNESLLPSAALQGGPVLALDIDGVCSPVGEQVDRYDIDAPTPGFVDVTRQLASVVQVHPALPDWITTLDQAFAQCAWVSTWRRRCRYFAEAAGLDQACEWPCLMPVDDPPVPGAPLPFYKLEAARGWVSPETPVAIVDDHLCPDEHFDSYELREETEVSTALFVQRPGPTLLIAPDPHVGLTRPIVDLLCRFAQAPYDAAFGLRCTLSPDRHWWVQWPWPLPPGQEAPALICPDDKDAWRAQRAILRSELEAKRWERY